MNVLLFLKGEFRQCRGIFLGLTLLLALSLAVACSVVQTERMVKRAAVSAADQFDILVGARGSRSALLLSTVYLREEMTGLVPMPVMRSLSPNPADVAWAAPVAFGDRAGASPLVGTTRAFVTQGDARRMLAGRVFSYRTEAVAGALSGFSPGETFSPTHSAAGLSHGHRETFTVVGILPETGTPWDRAVLIPIESLWAMHGPLKTTPEKVQALELNSPDAKNTRKSADKSLHADSHHDHEDEAIESWLTWSDEDFKKLPGASALVVKPTNMAGAYRIRQHLLKSSAEDPAGGIVNIMAVFTGEALLELLAVFSTAAAALKAFAGSSAATSLAAALLTGFVLARLREKDLRLLRTMGAPRSYVFSAVWSAIALAVTLAAVIAWALGTLFSLAAGRIIEAQSGVAMHLQPGLAEVGLLAAAAAAGALFAVIPAVVIGRKRLF